MKYTAATMRARPKIAPIEAPAMISAGGRMDEIGVAGVALGSAVNV
jgi:hypothetical protein